MDEDDRARWNRLIVFALVMVLIVIVVVWWSGWFYAGMREETGI